MNKTITIRKQKLYCKYCKGTPTVDVPSNIDLNMPSSTTFVENLKCTICKNIGYVRR